MRFVSLMAKIFVNYFLSFRVKLLYLIGLLFLFFSIQFILSSEEFATEKVVKRISVTSRGEGINSHGEGEEDIYKVRIFLYFSVRGRSHST